VSAVAPALLYASIRQEAPGTAQTRHSVEEHGAHTGRRTSSPSRWQRFRAHREKSTSPRECPALAVACYLASQRNLTHGKGAITMEFAQITERNAEREVYETPMLVEIGQFAELTSGNGADVPDASNYMQI
jgi:hypothetical protein